ncbi:MAG TPA: formate/nitrite transporter family protein [Candidatus Baltobacteraceae bacterium]|jgi:formate-nitrite transporter family protein|nr:formate/nitrite transporter family protein [Candidatus Baltobacteraceae bacterium]
MAKAREREKPAPEAAVEVPISTASERKQVEERVAIGPHIVYEAIRREGEEELRRPAAALAWSGLAAGLSMGFSFIAEALLQAYLPDQPWRPLLAKAGYSVGFLIVVLGRQQLFTESTLTAVLPLLLSKDKDSFIRLVRLWGIVLPANLAGTFLFAFCVAHIGLFDGHVQQCLGQIGGNHLGIPFGIVFVRAIFAGWLIALMVWLLPGAEQSRVSVIIIITYLIGLGAFSHVIAGSTAVFYLVAAKTTSVGTYLSTFFLPTLLGNIVGGVSLVAALGHGQVLGGKNA